MNADLIELLRCPRTHEGLMLDQPQYEAGRIRSGWLVSAGGGQRYPIRDFIPRFAPESNYADNFGMQWNRFRRTQLDSCSGQSISADRFFKSTGWHQGAIRGQRMLDVGCGAGRFAEVALASGARLVALDYSSAVDACYANLAQHTALDVVQGDIYALPFAPASFAYVYSLGVLQHTPDVYAAFAALPPMVRPGGHLCVDFYGKRFGTLLHSKYLLRPITKHMSQRRLLALLESTVPTLLAISRALGRVPAFGPALKRLVPVANYAGIYPLNARQLEEWALLDTLDMLAPRYDQPQTASDVRRWLGSVGLSEPEVFSAGHLVARGSKPP